MPSNAARRCAIPGRRGRPDPAGLCRLSHLLAAALIPSFRERYPKVGLEFYEATSAEILEGLASRRFDAGLLLPVLEAR
jgi:DNA-binding transcriptional LysR family regulator